MMVEASSYRAVPECVLQRIRNLRKAIKNQDRALLEAAVDACSRHGEYCHHPEVVVALSTLEQIRNLNGSTRDFFLTWNIKF